LVFKGKVFVKLLYFIALLVSVTEGLGQPGMCEWTLNLRLFTLLSLQNDQTNGPNENGPMT